MIDTAQARAAEQIGRRPAPAGPLLVTGLEAARRLGVSKRKLYSWLVRGWLPSIRDGRRLYIPQRALDELMQRIIDGKGPALGA